MCQAIVKPAGVLIEKSILKRAWNSNQDGAGFCYPSDEGDVIKVEKGFFKFKHFWRSYRKHESKNVLIHFRWATHGGKSIENCHPFTIGPDAALIHNGILSGFTPMLNSPLSDTRVFVERFLAPGLRLSGLSTHDYLSSQALRGFIEMLIGASNKFAVMTTKGIVIFNEYQGEWRDGVWYSSGFPEEDWLFHYPNLARAATSRGVGDDSWYDDIIVGIDRDKDEACCALCENTAPPRLYSIDGQNVCGLCFSDYSGLEPEKVGDYEY